MDRLFRIIAIAFIVGAVVGYGGLRAMAVTPRRCPPVPTNCFPQHGRSCSSNKDCTNGTKCCDAGCGRVHCLPTVADEPRTDCPDPDKLRPLILCMPLDGSEKDECRTDEECDKAEKCCINPCSDTLRCITPDVCSLSKDPGPCYGYFPKWYYDFTTGVCVKFIYGGCGGNENRFHTELECKRNCTACQDCETESTTTVVHKRSPDCPNIPQYACLVRDPQYCASDEDCEEGFNCCVSTVCGGTSCTSIHH